MAKQEIHKWVESVLRNPESWIGWVEEAFLKDIPYKGIAPFAQAKWRDIIVEQLLDGSYEIRPPHVARIPKDDGGFREVYVNTAQDRVILAVLNDLMIQIYGRLVSSSVMSYTRGIGPKHISRKINSGLDCLKKRGTEIVGFKVDISKYFDSVPIELIEVALEEFTLHPGLDRVLWRYYHDNRICIKGEFKEHYKSIGQGCAVSAFLANILLADLDDALTEVCDLYIRYSDDMLIFAEDTALAVDTLINGLGQKGLYLKESKISLIESQFATFEYVGIRFRDGKIGLATKSHRKLMAKAKELAKNRKDLAKGGQKELKKYIACITSYLYGQDIRRNEEGARKRFSWADYCFSFVTDEESILELDRELKDLIRARYTGKWNYTHNVNKVSNEMLRELGYKSIHHMWKCYKMNPDLYRSEVVADVQL